MAIPKSFWFNDASGNFATAAAWSPTGVPVAADEVFLTPAGSAAFSVTSAVNESMLTLSTAATATLAITGGVFTVGEGVANAGAITVGAGATLVLGPSALSTVAVLNSGSIAIASTGAAAKLQIASVAAQFGGGGTVKLSGAASIVAGATASTLRNTSDTIVGSGAIGSANLSLINGRLGVINANGAAALVINTGANKIENAGLIESTGAGGVTIASGLSEDGRMVASAGALRFVNSLVVGSGSIKAIAAGTSIVLNKATLNNAGIVSTVAGSKIVTFAGTSNTISSGAFSNAGVVAVTNNSTLIGQGSWTNTGAIDLNGTASATKLEVSTTLHLSGGGSLVLGGSSNTIASNGATALLVNEDNTISGGGAIGGGDAKLNFVNAVDGTVNAGGPSALTINTGATVVANDGVFASNGAGGLTVVGSLYNNGAVVANQGLVDLKAKVVGVGVADINGAGEIEFGLGSSNDVYFGAGAHGVLRLDNGSVTADALTGQIYGFGAADKLDLSDVAFSAGASFTYTANAAGGLLSVTDGTHTDRLELVGNYTSFAFTLATDSHGGTFVS